MFSIVMLILACYGCYHDKCAKACPVFTMPSFFTLCAVIILFPQVWNNPEIEACLTGTVCTEEEKDVIDTWNTWLLVEFLCITVNFIVATIITIQSCCDKKYPFTLCCGKCDISSDRTDTILNAHVIFVDILLTVKVAVTIWGVILYNSDGTEDIQAEKTETFILIWLIISGIVLTPSCCF